MHTKVPGLLGSQLVQHAEGHQEATALPRCGHLLLHPLKHRYLGSQHVQHAEEHQEEYAVYRYDLQLLHALVQDAHCSFLLLKWKVKMWK
jgi:hypothetical protein